MFKFPKQLFAYFDLDPSVKKSGNFTGTKNKMSKRILSFLLFLIMLISSLSIDLTSTFAASPPGTNLARLPGCVYSADYSESGREPQLAFDGNRTGSNSRWAGGDSHSNNWLRIDLPEVEPINKVDLYFETLTKGSNSGQLNGLVVIECSRDGIEWREMARQTYSNYTPKNVTLTFQALYASHIRVRFPETQFWLSLYEFEVYYDATATGPNLARLDGCSYSAFFSESNRGPALAFDGNTTGGDNRWAGGNQSFNWLRVDLPSSMPVSFVKIFFEALTKGGSASQLNGTVIVESSGDGVEWQELTRQVYSNYTPKDVTLSFTTQYTQHIRLYFPENQYYLSVYELEVYYDGSTPSGDPTQLRNTVRDYQTLYTDSYISQFKMSSRNVYKAALENALNVLKNPLATQSEVDAARTALIAAVSTSGSGNFRNANRIVFTNALKATALEDWNELLYNLDNPDEDDWRAGDGLRSIPLNGVNGIGSGDENTPSLFLFSDSYVSSFKDISQSLHLNWLQMPNHVFADFSGVEPDKSKLSFIFGEKGDKSKLRTPGDTVSEGGKSNVIPEGYWVQDAIVIGSNLYILFDHQKVPELVTENTSMVKVPILDGYKVDWENYKWLGYTDLWDSRSCFGVDILDNTTMGGIPVNKADDYVYVYANVSSGSRRCGVARVKKADFENTEKWEFYTTGGVWAAGKANIANAGIITPSNFMISSQHSVTYINSGIYEGKYLMTYTEGGISERIGYLLADNPWGPFTNPTICYIAPEVEQFTNELYQFDNPKAWYVTYTAVAHPQLSKPGELIISYDCFVWDSNKPINTGWHGTETNEHYRERFFKLDLNKLGSIQPQDAYTNVSAGKTVTASSGANPANVADTNDVTKWESSGTEANKWLKIDLGKPTEVGRYILKHGGVAIVHNNDLNARNYLNTRKFKIQYSNDNQNWTTVVDKQYNAYFQNDENFKPTVGRYWRLYIEQPSYKKAKEQGVVKRHPAFFAKNTQKYLKTV